MKRILLVAVLAALIITVSAQSSIDRLFEKYQGSEGFTTVTINGNLLKFLAEMDDDEENDEFMKHANKFSSIRILAQDDDAVIDDNFYDMVIDEVNRGGYEELIDIKSSDSDVKIVVKIDGNIFSEFLLVAGGDDNALIQIKGNMSRKDVKEMSASIKEEKGSIHMFGNY